MAKAEKMLDILPEGYAEKPDSIEVLARFMDGKTLVSAQVIQEQDEEIIVSLDIPDDQNKLEPVLGFMSHEDFDFKVYAGYEGFVGEIVDVVLLEYVPEREMVRVSRKEARALKQEALLPQLEVGMTIRGVVKGLQDYAAFVDIGGIHAILYVNEISHEYIETPASVLQKGDVLDVVITKVNRETGKVEVSRKALLNDSWEQVAKRYKRGACILGEIVGVLGEQIYVRSIPTYGVDLLCRPLPVPDRPHKVGQKVRVRVTKVCPEEQKFRGAIISFVR